MTEPLLSVIVPVYKVERYLAKCVQSIVQQTYQNLEIILVDDGSPDGCPALCDAWALKDSRIKVIHKENGGLSDARNAGLDIATGEYIGFVDSDDWLEPHFYEYLMRAALECHCDAAGCGTRRCAEGHAVEPSPLDFEVKTYAQEEAMSALIADRIQTTVWNKIYHKDIVQGIPFEKGKYHEDVFWMYQVIGRVSHYAAVSYVGYNYLQRTDSIMGEKYSLKRLDGVEAKALRQKYLQIHFPDLALQGNVELLATCLYQGQFAAHDLTGAEKAKAITYLRTVFQEHKLSKADLKKTPFRRRMRFRGAQLDFERACRLFRVIDMTKIWLKAKLSG